MQSLACLKGLGPGKVRPSKKMLRFSGVRLAIGFGVYSELLRWLKTVVVIFLLLKLINGCNWPVYTVCTWGEKLRGWGVHCVRPALRHLGIYATRLHFKRNI